MRKKQQRTVHISRRKRHITQQPVSRFPLAIRTLDCFPDVFACIVTTLDQCCVLIVRCRNNQTEWRRDVHGWNSTQRIFFGFFPRCCFFLSRMPFLFLSRGFFCPVAFFWSNYRPETPQRPPRPRPPPGDTLEGGRVKGGGG